MSKKILIIESDAAFMGRLRDEFRGRGFEVVETSDGKVAAELARREKPDLVVLAVELSAGQSGYIVCGKIKKDDDLKKIPVVIIGKDAEGFESHKRLKARAEEYVKKPFEPSLLLEKIGALVGMPEPETADLVLDDDSLGLSELGASEQATTTAITASPDTRGGDPDLDALDAAFETISDDDQKGGNGAAPPPAGDGLIDDMGAELETVEPQPETGAPEELDFESVRPVEVPVEPPPRPSPRTSAPAQRPLPKPQAAPLADDAELHGLRARVGELESELRDAQEELSSKTNELEAIRSTTGGKDKEFFSLKEQNTKKDKEIVRLKQDLNEKEQEVVDLREKETKLEQRISELTTEFAKRDAQIKTQTQKADGLTAERKKLEAAVTSAKDEVRQASQKLATAQGELDQAQDAIADLQSQLTSARNDGAAAKAALGALKDQYEQVNGDLDAARTQAESMRQQADRARRDLEGRIGQLEEEEASLRGRISELEAINAKNEERIVKAYQKIKNDEKLRDRTKKALAVALQLLEENSGAVESKGVDEEAMT